MRKLSAISFIALALAACAPLAPTGFDTGAPSSATSGSGTVSSSSSSVSFVEIPATSSSASSKKTGTGSSVQRATTHGILEIGDADAPFVMTVFTNFSCSYCREFAVQMLPEVLEEFVREGALRVRLVITPLKKYPNSAAEAAALLCATTSGKGREMFDALTASPLRDRKTILALAKKLELPTKEFTACLDAKETKRLLGEQAEFISSRDVTLIPAFSLETTDTLPLASGSGSYRYELRTGLPSAPDFRGWVKDILSQRP